MYLSLLSVAASIALLSGQHVTQNPTDLIEAVGRTVRFECLHNIASYNQILLYRQRGLGMQLIGNMYYATSNFEDGQKNVKFEGSSETGKTCKITISELHPNISGVYYCAASYHGVV
ncbi:immunoglobulin omega chain-like [Hippocampus comes]|uniref:immunoglobulin omega chain-like n=1 Tax=Hippocampus comes TaxID=109280 RepID=UPI00094EA9E2|nr:PREDICTED: immunoglobulin omega chain-like [Hippocampus comes]